MTMTMLVMMLQVEDDDIRSDLEKIQPVPAIDTLATISPEQVDNVSSPPRTACSGPLLAYTNPTVTGKLKILNKIIIAFTIFHPLFAAPDLCGCAKGRQ